MAATSRPITTIPPTVDPFVTPSATITLIPELGSAPSEYAQNYAGTYENYWIRMKFFSDKCVFQMPNSQPGSISPGLSGVSSGCLPSIVQYADPADMLTIEWAAVRVGLPPVVPNPDNADPQLILSRATVNPQAELDQLQPDGVSLKYVISGTYLYYVIDRTKVVLQTGLLPWIRSSMRDQTVLTAAIFQNGITDAALRTIQNPNPRVGGVAVLRGGGVGGVGLQRTADSVP